VAQNRDFDIVGIRPRPQPDQPQHPPDSQEHDRADNHGRILPDASYLLRGRVLSLNPSASTRPAADDPVALAPIAYAAR